MTLATPPVPDYGTETIADLLPSAVALIDGSANTGGRIDLHASLYGARSVAVLLVDGLGQAAIDTYPDVVPTLRRLSESGVSRTLRTGLPSTTAASIVSVGTGLPPGRHGYIGYTAWLASIDTVVNLIHLTRHGATSEGSLAHRIGPEELQPLATVFDAVKPRGIHSVNVSPAGFRGTPLTVAALRGAEFSGWESPRQIPELILAGLQSEPRSPTLVYGYFGAVDLQGHIHGFASTQYRDALAEVDAICAQIVEAMPKDSVLLVTGDHGMLDISEGKRIDVESEPELNDGIRALSGEPRFRHIHCKPGATAQVHEAWESRFGESAWIVSREQAISENWFGPVVDGPVARRIGDVVVAFDEPMGAFQAQTDPLAYRLNGHHGSFSAAESVVPLAAFRG